MTDPSNLRDSTQIVLPRDSLEEVRPEIEEEFTVTIHESEEDARIIGSPVVIKQVSRFLSRQGMNLP
ncbi:MAG: hypothetical protein ABEJ58_06900 [Halodesulfurarchaeum sp.]